MANILLSYFAELGEPLYDAMVDVLLRHGNNIFRFNINNPVVKKTSWGGDSQLIDKNVLKEIKEFSPDLILNFNNSLPINIIGELDECLNCVIDADNPDYFWNRDNLFKRTDEIFYLGYQSDSRKMYENSLKAKLNDDNYLFFPPATTIVRRDEIQDKNITFIGTNFLPICPPQIDDFYTENSLIVYDKIRGDYYYDIDKMKAESGVGNVTDVLITSVRDCYVGQERLKHLQCLTDLGLTIYGVRWDSAAYYDLDIFKCFDSKKISTMSDNEWVYNTSKVSINISHPQATSSFSWRVMDIMASNACLVSEPKKDWDDLFGKYITDEVRDAIFYADRFELREKVKELLSNDSLRNKCVSELNKAIEENGRWESRFSQLERKTGVRLLNNTNSDPQYIFIQRSVPVHDVVVQNESVQNEVAVESKPPKELFLRRLVRNGIYKVSHVPKIRHYLWDIIRP